MAWQPGQSGNPHGARPRVAGWKSQAAMVRKRSREGAELVDFLFHLMRETGPFRGRKVPLQLRKECAVELLNRGFGRPVQMIEAASKDGEAGLAGVVFVPIAPRIPQGLPQEQTVEAEVREVVNARGDE